MNTLEAFEAIRRKHLRQNRDIINVQALKIKQLESEIGRLTVENLELRSNSIAVTEQILRERRQRGQDPHVEATKTTLRNVIKQLTNTLASYGGSEELRGIDDHLLTMLTPEPEGTKLIPDEPMVKDLASQASASGKPVGRIVPRRPRPQVTKELSSIFEAGTEDSEEAETPSPLISMDLPRIIEPISMSDVDAPLESPAILSDEQLERLQGDLDMSSNFKRKSNIFAPPQDEEMKEDSSKGTKSSAGRKRKAPNAGSSQGPRRRSGAGGDFKGEHLLDSKENVDLSVLSVKSAPTSPDSRERRNRKSVNYALPSLRVKMRREDPPMFPVAVGKVPEWSAKDFDKSRKSKGEKRDRSRSQSPSANEIIPRRESLSAPTTPRPRSPSLSPPASPTDTPTRGMLIDSDNFERDETPLQLDRRRKQRRESFQVVNGLGLIDADEDLEDVMHSDVAPAEGNIYNTT